MYILAFYWVRQWPLDISDSPNADVVLKVRVPKNMTKRIELLNSLLNVVTATGLSQIRLEEHALLR